MSEAVEAVNTAAEALPETETPKAESAGVEAQPEGAQAVADAADPVKQAKPEEDPEFELDKDLKLKKSELARLVRKRKELDRGAFEKFQKAAEIQKRFDEQLSRDPEAYLRERGVDPIQWAVERLQREVALKEATPEQRRILELEAERQRLLSEREQFEEQQANQHAEAEKQQFIAKLDRELPPAVQKQGLPTEPIVFRAVASVIADQIRNGLPEDPEGAAEIVADAYRATFKQHIATLKPEDAIKQYPEFAKLVRDADLARARSAQTVPARPAAQPSAPRKPAESVSGDKKFNDFFAEKLSGVAGMTGI